MATIVPNIFTSYQLTPEEEISGSILNGLQQQVIQNHVAEIAQQRLAIEPNPSNMNEFIQREAYLRGQIDSLLWLLDISQNTFENNYDETTEVK